MKRALPTSIVHMLTVMFLGSIVIEGWVQNDKLKRELNDRVNQVNHWEQLYRDCQAARQFGEPTHAADAANDVTR